MKTKDSRGTRWFVRASAETTLENGKQKRWCRKIPLEKLPERSARAIREWIGEHVPSKLLGCTIIVTTPIHSDIMVVDPDTRECHYCAMGDLI